MKTPFPLHPAQQDVYTDQFINVDSPHYNIGGYIILKGYVDKATFHQTINTAATVFDAFKMRFDPNEDEAVFYIDNDFEKCALAELDFSGAENADEKARVWMQNRFNTPFAIEKEALLFEHVLIQISETEHWYFCRCHHLITDGYGFTVWVQYMAGKYQSLITGTGTAFNYPQYTDEASKAIAYKNGDEYEADGNYWKEKILQAPEKLLTKKYSGLDSLGNESSTFILSLNDSQRKLLDDLQLTAKCSLQQLTIAALLIYFAKTTGQTEFVFGVPVHKRNSKRLRSVIGMFSGILPFKGLFQKEKILADLLKEISATQRSDYRHQHYLIGDLAKHLKINAYERYLCEVIINYEPLFFDLSFGDAIQATIYRLANEFDRNPLQLSWRDYATLQPLQLHIHYRNEYFNSDEIALLAQRVLFILEQFAGKMDDKVESINILPSTEQALLHSLNATSTNYPKDKSIVALFEEQVLQTPQAIALVFEQQRLTYQQLNERSNQLAYYLRSRGIQLETLIPVCVERSIELIIAILGILKAGAAYVPVDTAYPAERIRFMLHDISATILITSKAGGSVLPPIDAIDIIEVDDQAMLQQPSANLQTLIKSDNLAYVIYTSGSTGRPKGVLVEHGNVVSLVKEAGYVSFNNQDVLLSTGSPSFDATTFEYWGMLLNGGQLVMATENCLLNSESLKAIITERAVTKMWFTASWFNQLTDTDSTIFEGLQTILVGGEKLSELHISKVLQQYPSLTIINGYGPTENTTFSITHHITVVVPDAAIPIGRPLHNRTVFILDNELHIIPIGITGEIYLGGAGLARGYLNQPALTAEKFITKRFANGQQVRLYKTGDLGRILPDGTIQYAGRKDEQVKIRGHRIELGEIETVLQQSGLVQQSVIKATENADGTKRLAGYVVAATFDKDAIVAHLKMKLPEYMVPMLWTKLDQLPLTANGKIDKEALPESDATEQRSNAYTAPRTEAETTLAGIWQELLHIENVGIHDNFFELGGDSIIAIQLVSRAKRAGLLFQPKDIFIHQTIANLCKNITSDKANSTIAEQGLLTGPSGLLPIQQWYFSKLPENVSFFNQKLLLKIDRNITPAMLQQAFKLLIEHHDALRFTYTKKDNTWLQEYGQAAVEVSIEDLQSIPTYSLQSEINKRVNKHQRNLNIKQGKLVRAVWMNMPHAEQQNRLLIVIHHLAIDGVSWRILLEDLELILSNLTNGTNAALSTKTSSYRQWYQALEQYSQSKKLQSQKGYWEAAIKQNELLVAIKNDGVPNANNIGTHTIQLSAAQTQLLLQEVPGVYHTIINDILLCALAITLCEHTNKDAITIGLEGHGREQIADKIDTSRTIGWFTSLYPVLLRADTNTGLDGWIKTIKEQLRQVPDNGLGYGVLKYINKEFSLQGTDPWNITFNYLGQLNNATPLNGALQIADEAALTGSVEGNEFSVHLSIESYVLGGKLILQWNYRKNNYDDNVIGQLAAAYIANLQRLIEHCMEQAKTGVVFTPADYGLHPEVSYAAMDKFLDEPFRGQQRRDWAERIYRLSGLQQGMLFHALYSSTSGAYISQFTCNLYDVDVTLFRKSWEAILQSHSILRSCFYANELSIPVQCVYRTADVEINELDYQHLGEAQQQAIDEYIQADSRKGFDFKQGPLTRFSLMQLGHRQYKMLWTTHHILFDGWSLPVLMGEFLHNYELLAASKTLPQKEEDKYEDFISYVERADKEGQEKYWRTYLKNVEQSTLLPFIKNEASRTRGVGRYAEVFIQPTAELQAAIQAYAQKARVTVNTMMQGVWAYLLSQYTRNEQVLYAVTVSGRPDDFPDIENRVGMYINTLPLHSHIRGEQKVVQWLQQMQDEQLASREYQHTPINDIQSWTGISGDLFDSLLVFLNYPVGKMLPSKQWLLRPDNVHMYEQNNFPLTITITSQDVVSIAFSYNTLLLKEAYIHQIKKQFEQVLTQIIQEPETLLKQIEWLSPAEKKQLLFEFNPTHVAHTANNNVIAVFEEQIINNATAVALIYENQQLTFDELNQRSNQVAHYLQSKGVAAGTLVPVCIEPGLEMIVAILGILKAGAAYVPIDPAYPQERISYILQDVEAAFLLTNSVSSNLLKNKFDTEIIEIDNNPQINNQSFQNLNTPIEQEHVAYIIYTSGSTGKPKGVMVAHGSLSNYLFNEQTSYIDKNKRNQSGTFAHLAYTFDASLTSIFMPLLAGKRIVLGSKAYTNIFDNPNLWKYAPYDFIKLTPAHLQLLQHTVDGSAEKWLTRKLVLGGEALQLSQFDYYIQRGVDAEIINEYGPTEATVGCSTFSFHLSNNNEEIKDSIPIGKPINNTSLYVLGSNRELLPIGITGEIYIGGAGLAKGYFNQPELTAEKFIENPFDETGISKLYRTGDLGYWLPDGNMVFAGRADEQVKIRGYRIELGEIESVLQQYEQINGAVVLTREDAAGNKQLVAYVVAQDGFDKQSTIAYLQNRLPAYMVPDVWVQLESLPLTTNGKIDKKALPNPEINAGTNATDSAPRNEQEQKLAAIWQELLELDQVSIQDDFFEIGGHSLLAIRVISSIRRELGVELTINDIFDYPTIQLLAEKIQGQSATDLLPAVVAGKRPLQIPLSYSQERLWFIDQLEGSVPYHIAAALRLIGHLHITALENALREIVNRHEILRTVYSEDGGQAYQIIKPANGWSLSVTDGTPYKKANELQQYIKEVAHRPFNLSKDDMLRVELVTLAAQEHILVVTMHHIASDAWSMPILVNEFAALYNAYNQERSLQLPAPQLQFADYAVWQRAWLQGETLATKLQYWKEKLDGVLPLQLPTDYTRPPVSSTRGASASFHISPELKASLLQVSQQNGATLYMTLLAAFNVLLYRYSGQEDICVGTSIAGRPQRELEDLIGFFVNTLALRNGVNGSMKFTELLEQVRTTMLEAYAHQEVPFEKVVEAVVKDRDTNRSPLFQVMLVLRNTPDVPDLQLGNLVVTSEPYEFTSVKFDLTFFLTETGAGLEGSVLYSTDLFGKERMERMIAHFITLLNSVVTAADSEVGSLQMLSEAEENSSRQGFNVSSIQNMEDKTVVALFEKQAQLWPASAAVSFEGTEISYAELNERSNRLAHYLRQCGVTPDTLVPLFADRSPDMITGILGILKAGGAYVPVDAGLPQERVSFMLQDTAATVVVCSAESREKLLAFDEIDIIEIDGTLIINQPTHNPNPKLAAQNLAYLIYTSGSTGQPKGVMVTHGNLTDYVQGLDERTGINSCNSFALVSTIATDLGNTVLYASLVSGGTLHVFSREAVSNIEYLHEYFKDNDIDCVKIVPSHWKALMMDGQPLLPRRLLVFGGESLQAEQVALIKNSKRRKCRLVNHYGPTETTVGKLLYEVDFNKEYAGTIPIGKPFGDSRIYVLSSDGALCPAGVPGQLYIGGAGVAKGYLNNQQLTSEKLIADPFNKEAGLVYKTGDLVQYDADGNIVFLGRIDDQVKIRGYRVEPGEVERVITASGLVTQVVVLALDDKQQNKRLVAYVAAADFDREALNSYLKEKLPDYMIPAAIIALDSLPLTSNGKIDRKQLPDPDSITAPTTTTATAATETEAKLAEIWKEILEVDTVDIHDDFFELGGHSLLAVRLISAIRKAFSVEMPIGHIFDYPTVSLLAAQLPAKESAVILPVVEVIHPRPEHIPLSFSQERLWFIDRLEGSVQYHVPAVLQLNGALNKTALGKSFQEIIRRHQVLRSVIINENGTPYQYLQQADAWEIEMMDGTPYQSDIAGLQRLTEELISKPFDLSKDFMLRAHLICFAADKNVLVVTLHHIASDGWSRSVLVRELVELYKSFEEGRIADLKALPVQYADYSLWQRKYLQGELLDNKLDYWKRKLDGVAALELPTDYVRPAVWNTRGAMQNFTIDKTLTAKLESLSRQHGATLFMVVLSAFKVLLHRYSQQQDICVGTPVAGRQQHDLEGLIGFFVNTLAIRSSLNSHLSFIDLLQQVRTTTLEAFGHQEIPFEKVVDAIVKERDLSRNPLFQVMFVLRNTPEVPELRLGEVQLSVEAHGHTTAMFDIQVFLTETPQGLEGMLEYNTDLYQPETIARLLDHYTMLLASVAATPMEKIGLLPMLTPAEKQQVLIEFNNTVADYPKEKTIIDLFEEQVLKTPDAIATIFEKQQLTYATLNERANQLAHFLRSKGVKGEVLVPVCLDRSLEMIVAILGILKAGGAYVPIDPAYPAERIQYMLEDVSATLVLTTTQSSLKLPATAALEVIKLDKKPPEIEQQLSSNPDTKTNPTGIAYVIYTSGSTGRPKGVMNQHDGLANRLMWAQSYYGLTSADSVLQKTTFCFDVSVWELLWPLITGARLVFARPEGHRDNVYLKQIIAKEKITLLHFVPSMLSVFLSDVQPGECAGLKKVLCSGEALTLSQTALFKQKLPHAELHNLYGPTEAAIDVTYWSLPQVADINLIPIGKPVANTPIYIVDPYNQPVPVGVAGEICIGGIQVARGYLNQPALTAEKFVADPFSQKAEAKMYKTGDLGKWLADGNIAYLGRMDTQVKVRGFRIELSEVETALNELEYVNTACVVAKADVVSSNKLVAYYVPDTAAVKAKEAALYQEQVAAWKEVYENEYEQPKNGNGETNDEFNIVSWNDSFTGQAIAAPQMEDWVQDIVNVILSEDAGNVLEIGCGTGLIYYRLAGKVKKYTGTDFSATSVGQIRRHISKGLRDYGPTELQVCAAHEVALGEDEKVDTVILNSVVQYFPGEDYMNEVISSSIKHLKGKGRIIIGDVRDKRTLELFKSRLQLQKLQGTLGIKEFNWAVEQEVQQEEELCFSPEYFYALQSRYPDITQVDIQWKQSAYSNEMSLYRYTVVLYVGMKKDYLKPEWQSWHSGNHQDIISSLSRGNTVVAMQDVPNPRLWKEQQLSHALQNNLVNTVGELLEAIAQQADEQKEIAGIFETALSKGYRYRLFLHENPLLVNVLFELAPSQSFVPNPYTEKDYRLNGSFTNIPLFGSIVSLLQREMRTLLGEKLPEYMVPSEFVALAKLPLTANGKVDRAFLGQREDKGAIGKLNYQPPTTALQKKLCAIWQSLLGVERVGISDNFFELGGHSLLGMRLISAIRKEMETVLSIKELFMYPTVASLAAHLNVQETGELLPAIEVQVRPAQIPLSFSQERLWFVDQLSGSVQYHLPWVIRLRGGVDTNALKNTFREILHRHEVLRTVISEEDGRGYQLLLNEDGWELKTVEATYKDNSEDLTALIQQLIDAPFDLSKDYMLRVHLLTLSEQEHLLVLTVHHIAADAWSMPIIIKEVAELYSAYVENRPVHLPALPIQYADYAIWQRTHLQGAVLDHKVQYWKEKLTGVAPLQLPLDDTRPAVWSGRGAIARFNLGKKLSAELKAFSQQQESTLFMTLLAAFNVLLHRYSNGEDICIGTSVANRNQQEVEGLIGFFVNILALRSRVSHDLPFTELLQQVKATTLEAYEYGEVPFEKVVDAVVTERDMSRNPLIQEMLILLNTPKTPELQLKDLTLSLEETEQEKTLFDISFYISETDTELQGWVVYATDLYSERTIAQMIGNYQELLTSILATPEEKTGLLPMLKEAEKQQLLATFNNSAADYPKEKTIVDLFSEQVQRTPEAIAIVFETEQLTYRELHEKSNQLARYLNELGVQDETFVPICIERSLEMIVGILGILKAGGVYVPIDPAYPSERINYMLEDTAATIILSSKKSKAKLPQTAGIISLDEIDLSQQPVTDLLPSSVSPASLAYVIYTSGSTGKPKGVMVEHRNVVRLFKTSTPIYDFNEQDVWTMFHSFCFDFSVWEMYGALLFGGRLVVVPADVTRDVALLADLIMREGVTVLNQTPSAFYNLQTVLTEKALATTTRYVIFGGEALLPAKLQPWKKAYPTCRLINMYGITETTVHVTHQELEQDHLNSAGSIIGRPIPTLTIYILDPYLNPVPKGVAGEIYVAGAGLARGYLNLPELTAQKFMADPFDAEPGSRMYKTGDLSKWVNGSIMYLGRIDEQVKIRGYRIELGEIESVLQQSGLVSSTVVVAREDTNGNKKLIGYTVAGENFDKKAVTAYLKEKLPEYMVPALWVEMKALPLTANGKVDKKALPDADAATQTNSGYAPPRNQTETDLAQVWQEILQVETVGIDDNFFELGGDSIITIQVISRLKRLGYSFQPKDIFIHQTIRNLSAVGSGAEMIAEQGLLTGEAGLLPIQQWYFEKGSQDVSYFNQSVLLKIDKAVTANQLNTAVETLIAHHDALRFTYHQQDGHWHQEYGTAAVEIHVENLEGTNGLLSSLITAHADKYQRNLHIEKGELLRVVLMQTPQTETDNRLFIVVHHLAVDGVSWRIMLEDLELLLSQGSLPNKTSSYRQWYDALRSYGQSPALMTQKNYWVQIAKNYSPLLTDNNYTEPISVQQIALYKVKLDKEQTQALLQEVPRVYHTEINDILLSALADVLCSLSNSDKIVIGLEGHGREAVSNDVDTTRTVGWFTSLYPVLLQAATGKGVDSLIKGVKEQLRQVPDKGLGYGVLKYINREEVLQGEEHWDVVFNYLGQFGNIVSEGKWLSIADEPTGAGRSEQQIVHEKLAVTSFIHAGELVVNWSYSSKHFAEETIKNVAADYLLQLQKIIAHCLKQAANGTVYTPSDYGLGKDVSFEELDEFLEEENKDNILSF